MRSFNAKGEGREHCSELLLRFEKLSKIAFLTSVNSFDLGGHGGRPQVAHDHSPPLVRTHAKNQPPRFETVAVNR